MRKGSKPVRYKLSGPVKAVKLAEQPGSSLRSPTATLIEIPAEATVELEGVAGPSGLANILWDGNAFSVFYEDLQENARTVDGISGVI